MQQNEGGLLERKASGATPRPDAILMAEDVRIPFVMDVKSVRILTAEEAAAEREAARDVPLGPHDVILPIKGAENLRTSPGLQEEIKRAQRAFDRRQAAEASRAVLAREARRRYIPPGTPPLLRKLYRNMLPSPNDPRPEDLTPDDATPDDETPDDAPDRSGPTALRGLRPLSASLQVAAGRRSPDG